MRVPLLVLDCQLADAMTFLVAVNRTSIAGESNGAMVGLYGAGGITAVLAVKLVGALLAVGIAARLGGRWWLVPAVVGIVGAITNLRAL